MHVTISSCINHISRYICCQRSRFLRNGSLFLIGQFKERNAELERAAASGEEHCVTTLITAAKETTGAPDPVWGNLRSGVPFAFVGSGKERRSFPDPTKTKGTPDRRLGLRDFAGSVNLRKNPNETRRASPFTSLAFWTTLGRLKGYNQDWLWFIKF